jgi:drug/metabolite transporter (DMT)-like permease
MRRSVSGSLFAAGAILLWSTVATAFELSLEEVSTVELLAGSTAVSLLFFAITLCVASHRPWKVILSARGLAKSAVLGLLNPALYYLVLFSAYDRLPGHQALILNYTWPLFLAILAGPLLGAGVRRRQLTGIVISFAGVLLVYLRELGSPSADIVGLLLGLASALIWSVYWLLNARDRRPVIEKLALGFAFGFLYILIGLAIVIVGHGNVVESVTFGRFSVYALLVYVGLAEMGVGFLLWLNALKYSPDPSMIGNFAYVTPFLSVLLLSAVMGEAVSALSLVGLVLIVGGIAVGKTSRAS